MACVAALHVQHIGALADITLDNNIPRVNRIGKYRQVHLAPTTRITSLSSINNKGSLKYVSTMDEEKYQKLLKTAESADLLNIGRSATSDGSVAPPSPNTARRDSGASHRASTPTTPPVTNFGGEQLVAINEMGSATLKPRSSVSPVMLYKGSPLDKELPPKPMLRAQDSPERRGLLDATDGDNVNLAHPVLQPEAPGGDSPESFKPTSSLGTPSTISGEIEQGTAIVVKGERVKAVSGMDFKDATPTTVIPIRASKDGNPSQPVQGLSSKSSNRSLKDRAAKYGVGPTLRKSADAHEIIMGPEASPHPPRTSSLPKAIKSTGQLSAASRLSRPTAASAARAAESKKSMATAGKSILTRASASKSSVLSPANKSVARGTPPSKASSGITGSSATMRKSDTSVTSVTLKKSGKGLKSRFTEMFSGRRRSTVYSDASSDNKGYATIASQEDMMAKIIANNEVDSPMPDKRAQRSSKLLTTYRDSGMNEKISSTENIRGDKKAPFMGKVSDRDPAPREQRGRKRAEQRVNRATQAYGRGMAGGNGGGQTYRGITRGGDEPPSPPPTRGGPAGHYGESEAAARVGNMTEEEFDRYLEAQLNAAQASLNQAIAVANSGYADQQGMNRITDVIQALGGSILTSRQALMAGIELRAATTNLIQHTTARAAAAREAVVEATSNLGA